MRILQINLDGWRSKAAILDNLAGETNPEVICIQETKLPDEDITKCPRSNWTKFLLSRKVHRVAAENICQGGIATLVKPGIKCSRLQVSLPRDSAMEILGIRIHHQDDTHTDVWNIYRPPAKGGADTRDARPQLQVWPTDKCSIICADANAHGSWDRPDITDHVGEEIDDWAIDKRMYILNQGVPTRIKSDGTGTAPDISVVHSSSSQAFSWKTLDSIGSDHLPILIDRQRRSQKVDRRRRQLNIKKADWERFQDILTGTLLPSAEASLEQQVKQFATSVLGAAQKSIPLTRKKPGKPWWNTQCANAKTNLNRALQRLRANPQDEDLSHRYNEAKSLLRETIASQKRSCWREYVANLDPKTPTTKVWNTLKAMDGRQRSGLPDTTIKHGEKSTVVSDQQKADLAIKTYAEVSRIRIPRRLGKEADHALLTGLRDNTHSHSDLANDFSFPELQSILHKLKNSAPGEDEIHPLMLKNLPHEWKLSLLEIFNRSWQLGKVPSSWRSALIIPIHKKKKPADKIRSYRPVSLLSCVSKVLESLVRDRMKTWAERERFIPQEQSGFQAKRSTLDGTAHIAQSCSDALQDRKRSLLVAVDFEAAFDTVWRGGLLRDLARNGMSSRILHWLKAFLSDRRAAVQWNNRRSRFRVFQAGVPQGSPLSPLLFNLFTASLPPYIRQLAPESNPEVYADDLSLFSSGSTPEEAASHMRPALQAVDQWAEDHLMKVCASKTEALVISLDPRETAGKAKPPLRLAGDTVKYSSDLQRKGPEILGITFDSQLRFTEQTATARSKLKTRTKIIQALAGTDWGMQGSVLRHLFNAYARPGGLYAAGVWYSFTSQTNRDKLESLNYQVARIITGAPKGSNAVATCREAQLPPILHVAEEESARLFNKIGNLDPSHYLAHMTTDAPRRRLKAHGTGDFRPCFRTTAKNRLNDINSTDVKEALKDEREPRFLEHYLLKTDPESIHRRATGGEFLESATGRTRTEETTLHRLRLNRHVPLKATKFRHGITEDPSCEHCGTEEEEDTEHFLLYCPRWEAERKTYLGEQPDLKLLQTAPENVLKFVQKTGLF